MGSTIGREISLYERSCSSDDGRNLSLSADSYDLHRYIPFKSSSTWGLRAFSTVTIERWILLPMAETSI